MEEQVVDYGLQRRKDSRNHTFFSRSDINSIIGRLRASSGRPPVVAAASARLQRQQRRGVGGASPVAIPDLQDPPKDFSDKVIRQFKVDKTQDNKDILLRVSKRCKQLRWVPVVALEDLPAVIKEHNEQGILYKCYRKLYDHLHNNAPTALSPGASGTVRIAYGLEGFDRESVEIFLQGCVVRNDQAPTKPEEQPPPAAIVTLAALVHCQMDLIDLGANRDSRYRYVLVYIDHFSRYVWLHPLPSKEPQCVIRALCKLWFTIPRPARLQSDNGTEFCAAAVKLFCKLWGVEFVQGAVGHPQSQGCVERHNRTIKDTISAQILAKPDVPSWVTHLWSVQKAVNNMPHAAHGGVMTPAQVLFGTLEPSVLLPEPAKLLPLLGLSSEDGLAELWDMGLSSPAAEPIHPVETDAPRQGRSRRSGARTKRTAAAAQLTELSDDEGADLADIAGLSDDEEALAAAATMAAMPARHSSRRAAAVGVEAAVAAEHGNDAELGQAAPTRALPPRTAAASSPAGKRRRLTAVLAAAERAATKQAAGQQAAGPSQAAGPDAAGQRGVVAAAVALTAELPHLKAVREKAMQQHNKNRAKISQSRKGKGKQEVQAFAVGDDVVLLPARKGKVGNPVGPKRISARVVGVSKPNGQLKYKVRTNTGVLPKTYFHGQLRKAVPGRADAPNFEGTEAKGVRATSEREARGNTVRCGCRGKGGECGSNCPCKAGGHKCGRHCGCKYGSGVSCGNC